MPDASSGVESGGDGEAGVIFVDAVSRESGGIDEGAQTDDGAGADA